MMNEDIRTVDISKVIKKRRNKLALKEGYISLLIRMVLIGIAGYLIFTQVFIVTRAIGNEMFPAVKDGDLVIGFRLQDYYEKNDVITYEEGGIRRIGRYIAQEGDVVILNEEGIMLINDTPQAGEIMYPTNPREGLEFPHEVPENHVFLLGDYRTQAIDSRDFGSISMDDVEGKVITILRRRGL